MNKKLIQETVYDNGMLKVMGNIVSYIFHPLFVPGYIFYFLTFQFPYTFSGITEWQMTLRIFGVCWMTAFFPAFSVFLLWKLGFSNSIFLRTQKERIIPFVITMFFYWWMYYLSRNFSDQPIVLRFFFMGIFLASAVGLIVNNYFKISLHAMAMGGASAAITLFSFYYHETIGIPIAVTIFLTGIVCSARLLVSDHTQREIYTGLFVGAGCQLAAYAFIM